jgi:hypothetical protein
MGVTNLGKAEIAKLSINSGSPTAFGYLEYGTGTTAFSAAQTALVTPSQRAAATCSLTTTSVSYDTALLTYSFSITASEAISEVGIFNSASSGVMWARTVLGTVRNVVNGDTYSLSYKVAFA